MLSFALGNWRLISAMSGVLTIAGIVTLGYIHYTSLVNERDALKQRELQYKQAIIDQEKLITDQGNALSEWKASVDDFSRQLTQTREIAQGAAVESRRLRGIFGRHDLESLARAKPVLIERRVNSGSNSIGRLLECATGAQRENCTSAGGTSGTSTNPGPSASRTD